MSAHAARPGSGPRNETCGTCAFLGRPEPTGGRRKCALAKGASSNVSPADAACSGWRQGAARVATTAAPRLPRASGVLPDDLKRIEKLLGRVIEDPADFTEFQVDFAFANADRIEKYGRRARFTKKQLQVIDQIEQSIDKLESGS